VRYARLGASAGDEDIARYKANLQNELDGADLYEALAAAERRPFRRDLFARVSHAKRSHAEARRRWLISHGVTPGRHRDGFRARILAALAAYFGPRFVLPAVLAGELTDESRHERQDECAAFAAEEIDDAAAVAAVSEPGRQAAAGRRSASGNDLRAAVLGANDGLASNFCLMMGVAGAGTTGHAMLLTGLAGLVAGACSMALGEWLSVSNARELAAELVSKQRDELEQAPESGRQKLATIYEAKGLPQPDAQRVAAQIMQNSPAALDTLMREGLGIDPDELGGNPWTAAGLSFALFAMGAIVPVLPLSLLSGKAAIAVSIVASGAALAVLGLLTSLFNGRSVSFSAFRQVLIGCAAAAVTYGAGAALGVSLT
jgi:VIT1/CCC1 family predicted Fe2+/Mn2+ transporter